jgi:hypothetical protein
MELLHRRTPLRRLVKPIAGSRLLDRRNGLRRKVKLVGDPQLPATIKSSVATAPRKALTSALAAVGGLVGLTAGSAAVSARRRRSEESSNDS